MAFLLSQSERKTAKPQSPIFLLPIELRDAIYDMLLPFSTLDQHQRLQWHQGETAIMYVCRKINREASRRLYKCLDVFYFADEECDDCLNVVPDLSHGRDSDISELDSSVESFPAFESVEIGDYDAEGYVMVTRISSYGSMW